MEFLRPIQAKVNTFLQEKNFFTKFLELIEVKTKVNREYIFYGIFAVLVLAITFDSSNFLANLIAVIYPSYASFKSIEAPLGHDTKWLMYWIMFGVFTVLEFFSDYLLFWVPLYSLTKCLFFIWLMIPGRSGGANIVYDIVKPLVLRSPAPVQRSIPVPGDESSKFE